MKRIINQSSLLLYCLIALTVSAQSIDNDVRLKSDGNFEYSITINGIQMEGRYIGNYYKTKIDGEKVFLPHEAGTFRTILEDTIYIGKWAHGKLNGFGRLLLADTAILQGVFEDNNPKQGVLINYSGAKYSGSFKGFRPHGQGILELNDIEYLKGDWTDGQFSGEGLKRLSDAPAWLVGGYYQGAWKNNLPDGYGFLRDDFGNYLRGIWEAGVCKKCEAKFQYSATRSYYGEFSNRKRNGYGELTYTVNNKNVQYKGVFLDDRIEGSGKMTILYETTNAEGVREKITEFFEGNFVDSLLEGNGSWTVLREYPEYNDDTKNYTVVQGTFNRGVCEGKSTTRKVFELNPDIPVEMDTLVYETYIGEYKNNLPDGYGVLNFESFGGDGYVYEGNFKGGLKSGYGVYFSENGMGSLSYKGDFLDDQYNGLGVLEQHYFCEDESRDYNCVERYEGEFKNNLYHGKGKLTENGLVKEGVFINGLLTD